MHETLVITDTSCLIALTQMEMLDILPQIYYRIVITKKEAKRLGFEITGTLGVLFKAKQKGLIPAVKPYIDKLQTTNFRISPRIVKEMLALSNET